MRIDQNDQIAYNDILLPADPWTLVPRAGMDKLWCGPFGFLIRPTKLIQITLFVSIFIILCLFPAMPEFPQ